MNAKISQPSIAQLTERLMLNRVASSELPVESVVELHDGNGAFRVEPRTAWADATFALTFFGAKTPNEMPADWAFQANLHATSPAIPLASGTFPQRLQDLTPLIDGSDFTAMLPKQGNVLSALVRPLGNANEECATNDRAAELWQVGRTQEAVELWQKLPASAVSSFNLGMAKLFLGQPNEAMPHLKSASEQLPETSGWNHLSKLYLALAQMKR